MAGGTTARVDGPTGPYPHSKGAVLQVTRDLAVAGAKHNIRVNALPGVY